MTGAVVTEAGIGQAVAELLVGAGAIHVSRAQPFFLAAGWASPVYVDVRLLLGRPETRRTVTELAARYLAGALAGRRFDAIVGAETAGMPFATSLADREGLALRYVRKHALGAGRGAQVEGGSVEGLDVLLMDDLTTDGASKIGFARGLRAAGARVTDILTIFYHDAFPGAAERLADAGLHLHPLATWADVLGLDDGLGAEDRAEVNRFLSDPVAWSTRHGGRTALAARF